MIFRPPDFWKKVMEGYKCPHCATEIFPEEKTFDIDASTGDKEYAISTLFCPKCKQVSLFLLIKERVVMNGTITQEQKESMALLYPKGFNRPALSKDVPKEYVDDYKEACLVLQDSPKASAALSRRCLQNILRNEANVKPDDLDREITEVLKRNEYPTYIASGIDAVRVIGNFAAHPIKSKNTGELVPVEEGEADWTLSVLESLFDFHFVQPKLLAEKRNALNVKLKEAGKPELK